MRRCARLFVFALLALMLGAQGVFAGATLCREENGEVSLEWASEEGCQASPAREALPCLRDGGAARATPEHCVQCIDVPLPSERSLQSSAVPMLPATPVVVMLLSEAPVSSGTRVASIPQAAAAFDGARTVRLLI
jgi:hypothetical protein